MKRLITALGLVALIGCSQSTSAPDASSKAHNAFATPQSRVIIYKDFVSGYCNSTLPKGTPVPDALDCVPLMQKADSTLTCETATTRVLEKVTVGYRKPVLDCTPYLK